MNILAIDTCTGACSAAAVFGHGGPAPRRAGEFRRMTSGQAEELAGMVARVVAACGGRVGDLERIAVTIGPGSFTGIRIGVAAARGLALVTGAGIVSMSSLEAVALAARGKVSSGALVVAMDARHGQLHIEAFAADGRSVTGPLLCDAAEAVTLLSAGDAFTAIGDGARALAEGCRAAGREITLSIPDALPDAAAMIDVAAARDVTSDPVVPLYLKPPDARPQAGAALPRRDDRAAPASPRGAAR